jgi:hydroxymethylpyrimidine/phosphomethylpyrimidine kinase
MSVLRCLTIATSDSGGGAGIQADLKAFAAAGCHGMSALVALTAQNTVGVTAIHELPPAFVVAQLEAVFDDIGVDAAKTGMLFSLATVVTPNLGEAVVLAGAEGTRRELAERIVERGAPAVVVKGGHGDDAVDHLFDGTRHVEIPVPRYDVPATHGAGCTHSATLAAHLARGASLEDAARAASVAASEAVRNGLVGIGRGDGPVDVLRVAAR